MTRSIVQIASEPPMTLTNLLLTNFFLGTGLLVLAFGGCTYSSHPATWESAKVTSVDQEIADQAIDFLRSELRSLSQDHPLVERYGTFLKIQKVDLAKSRIKKEYRGRYGDKVTVHVVCLAEFQKYDSQLRIDINSGTLGLETIHLFPAFDAKKDESQKQVQMEDGLWLVRPNEKTPYAPGNGVGRPCKITCMMSHPDVSP